MRSVLHSTPGEKEQAWGADMQHHFLAAVLIVAIAPDKVIFREKLDLPPAGPRELQQRKPVVLTLHSGDRDVRVEVENTTETRISGILLRPQENSLGKATATVMRRKDVLVPGTADLKSQTMVANTNRGQFRFEIIVIQASLLRNILNELLPIVLAAPPENHLVRRNIQLIGGDVDGH